MVKTTTNSIEFTDKGIIISRMKTRSGFKKVYVIEQANSINHEFHGVKKPLLLDLTRIEKSSLEEVMSLLSEETIGISSAIGILINSSFQKLVLNTYLNFKTKSNCPVQAFVNNNEAQSWLERYVAA